MADQNLGEFATKTFVNLIKAAKKISQIVALNSTRYAPKGWSGQLKRSIRANDPKINISTGQVFASVSAGASSSSGFQYAGFQHEKILRHYNPDGVQAQKGYSDFGTGKTRQARYNAGYELLKNRSSKYASKYMEKGLEQSDEQIDKVLAKV